jgi:hypothetical protein
MQSQETVRQVRGRRAIENKSFWRQNSSQKENFAAACMTRAGAALMALPNVELPMFPSIAAGPVN